MSEITGKLFTESPVEKDETMKLSWFDTETSEHLFDSEGNPPESNSDCDVIVNDYRDNATKRFRVMHVTHKLDIIPVNKEEIESHVIRSNPYTSSRGNLTDAKLFQLTIDTIRELTGGEPKILENGQFCSVVHSAEILLVKSRIQ